MRNIKRIENLKKKKKQRLQLVDSPDCRNRREIQGLVVVLDMGTRIMQFLDEQIHSSFVCWGLGSLLFPPAQHCRRIAFHPMAH